MLKKKYFRFFSGLYYGVAVRFSDSRVVNEMVASWRGGGGAV